MSLEQIEKAIPHRGSMLLVDRIVESGEDRIVCEKTFHAEEFFFQGHYPQIKITPGVILCEAAMQAGAILLSKYVESSAEGVPVATRMNGVKFKKIIHPGDTIRMEVDLVERMANAFFLKAKVTCQDKVAVRFEFSCTMASIT